MLGCLPLSCNFEDRGQVPGIAVGFTDFSGGLSTWTKSRHLGQVTKRRRRGQLSARLVHKKMRSDVTLSWRLAQQLLLRLWRRFWEHSQDRISAARVSDTRP